MKRLLYSFAAILAGLVAGALITASPAHADSFSTPDKQKHFAVSAALGAGASAITDSDNAAVALALVPGLAKELYDSRSGGTGFSWRDMVANAAGAYLGVKLGGLIIRPRFVGVSIPLR